MEALITQTTLQELEDYQPVFSELARRAEASRVESRYGRKIFDAELRESYEAAEYRMNSLLERLFDENVDLVFNETMQGVIVPTPEEVAEYGA